MEKVRSIPCMEGGSGADSYASNSLLQNYNFHTFAKPNLSRALDRFAEGFFLRYVRHCITTNPSALAGQASCEEHTQTLRHAGLHNNIGRVTVADFGCSYGRNTLDYAACIVQGLFNRLRDHMKAPLYKLQGDALPVEVEMQYFFSDLPSNNFNALLQSLEPFLQEQLPSFDEGSATAPTPAPLKWKLFTAAVAGSFHGRLFPARSLHLAISAYAVHWLSQIPYEVVERSSPAWNGGHVWIHGARPKVVDAYARQFQKDINHFLLTRADELAVGGILFLFFPCRVQKNPQGAFLTPQYDIWTGYYESTWEELVLEGLISEEERDMFNVPVYYCHKSEMLFALDKVSKQFEVLQLEVLADCKNLPKEEEQKVMGDSQLFGKFVANFVAGLMKPMMQECLGGSRTSLLLERLQNQATNNAHLYVSFCHDMLLATLERL